MALADFPKSYKDEQYAALDSATEQKLGLPPGMVQAIRTDGERSNADQVSSAGARTPYQFTPSTRRLVLNKYGVDAYLSPATASEATGLLLKEGLDRNQGDPEAAVREYHGGTNRENWGKQNDAYWSRVGPALESKKIDSLSEKFAQWNKANPATPSAPAAPTPGADPVSQKLLQGFSAWKQGADLIPDTKVPDDRAPVSASMPPAPAPQEPSLMDTAIGSGEAILKGITGVAKGTASIVDNAWNMVPGVAGMGIYAASRAGGASPEDATKYAGVTHFLENPIGKALGIQDTADYKNEATRQGLDWVGKNVDKGADWIAANSNIPKEDAQSMINTILQGAIPMAAKGVKGAARAIPEAVDAIKATPAGAAVTDAVATGASKVASLAKEATTLPRRALEKLTREEAPTPTPGTRASGGSMATDMATQRKATADQLPVPMGDLLTKGDLTRDPAQQKFEVETAKLPEEGKPLRDRIVAKNQAILDNFDAALDQTGAEAPTLRAVGQVVDKALVDKAARAKTEIRARYKAAENAGEMEAPVTLQSVVDHLNESAPDVATAPLLTTARARAIQTGLAIEGPDGQLVAQPVSLKRAETFRQAVGAATDYTPTNIRQSTIIKGLVDESTQGMGGDLYRQARSARARYAQEFENHAVISKLLNNKRGTADRQVAMEDIYNHTIQKGSLDDVRTVRKVLQTAGEDGKQAWRELQGATLRDIRDKSTQSVALDSAGNRVMSPAALDKAITALDADGKLDFIFGKKGAQTLRDIREIAQISRTVSPEAAINHSNTAMTLAALADTVFSGLSGIPAPIATTSRLALKHIKDVRLRNRISDALNEQGKQAPNNKRGAPPIHAPRHTVH